MTYKDKVKLIIDLVGGPQNIKHVYHCITRLRFNLVDEKKVNMKSIENVEGVLGVQYQGGQFQVIIGDKVAEYYKEAIKILDIKENTQTEEKKKFKFSMIFDTLSGIFGPTIGVIAGSGLLKGILLLLTKLEIVDQASGFANVVNIAGDAVFYFLPFILAVSAAAKLKVNMYLSLALAAALMHPSIINQAGEGIVWSFLGLPAPLVKYSASVLPIIMGVFVLKYVHKYVDKFVPSMVKIIFTPLITLLIMIPIQLIVIGPIGYYFSDLLVKFFSMLFETSSLLAGFVIGSTRPIVVITGMHMGILPVQLASIEAVGYDLFAPITAMNTLAQAGAALGVFYLSKNKATKSVAMSSAISAGIGVTEPGLYGISMKFRNALIATMLAGGISGAFVGYFQGKAYTFSMPGLLSLPAYVGPEFKYIMIGFIMAFVLGIVITILLGIKEEDKDIKINTINTKVNDEKEMRIFSPVDGEIIPLSKVNDKTFNEGLMGKGTAIIPSNNKIVAPFSGTIVSIFPTNHALMLLSDDGIEVLIHIGLGTVDLKGQHFELKCKDGDKVSKGDELVEVNFEEIKKLGYNTTTIIVVTNTDKYLDVIDMNEKGLIFKKEHILSIIK